MHLGQSQPKCGPEHTSSTVADLVLALHKPGNPEVLDLMIPLRRPSLTSTASLSHLMIHPQSTAEHVSTGQLSNYLYMVISGFFLLLGTFKSPDTMMVEVCCSCLLQSIQYGTGTEQSVSCTTVTSAYKGFLKHSAAIARLRAKQHALDIIIFILHYYLAGSP